MRLQNWSVTWVFWDPFMMSKHPAKFGVHRCYDSGDIPFSICHVTTWSIVTWLCGWGALILSDHPAKFGVHRPCGTGNNGVCNISSNPNSSSNAKVPMSRFTNGRFTKSFIEKFYKLYKSFIKRTCWYF